MKKVLGGCLAVVLIGVVALGLALFYGYRAARPMIDNARDMLAQARELAAISDRVSDRTDYAPPADGALSEAQVQRLLAVHAHVRQAMGSRLAELQAKAADVDRRARDGGRDLSFSELGSLVTGFGTLLRDARSAHVEGLNAQGFSSSEYNWVKLRVFEAAGFEVAGAVDWSSIGDALEKGTSQVGVTIPPVSLPKAPDRNRELVKAHVDELKDWIPLAMLGF
jgi:hypothetical protein